MNGNTKRSIKKIMRISHETMMNHIENGINIMMNNELEEVNC